MRKRIESFTPLPPAGPTSEKWLDLNAFSEVVISSEDADAPIESALVPGEEGGWRAATPGRQLIRIAFDHPQDLSLIRLVFQEDKVERTQEFVLRWSLGEGNGLQEIVRQQYNFSPGVVEVENYAVDLKEVRIIEIEIVPSISGGEARASLAELRIRGAVLAAQ